MPSAALVFSIHELNNNYEDYSDFLSKKFNFAVVLTVLCLK